MKQDRLTLFRKIARREAERERSDPFKFNRVLSHLVNGITDPGDYPLPQSREAGHADA